jgi:predicted O-methyltransferase YrrM
MNFDQVRDAIAGVPYLSPERGRQLYDHVLAARPAEILELGFAHGVSSVYMAAALDEIGAGQVTSVDLAGAARWQKPSIDELLARTGLARWVTVAREPTSYTWFLRRRIEERTSGAACEPCYDFVFVDGPKNWTIDGAAFFMADKLLRPGGWILFDDLSWTYAAGAQGKSALDGIPLTGMGADELTTPHVERIFRLLVMQHPDYGRFRIEGDWWGWAQKTGGADRTLTLRETASLTTLVRRAARRLMTRRR